MGGVPSIPTDPNRKIQVISAGFSRTGTVSLSLALEKLLDGPVCHGGTQMLGRENEYVKKWIEVYRCGQDKPRLMKKLAEVTRGFVAIADAPGNQFIAELIELYPDAKVIDVNRDPDEWLASLETVTQYTNTSLWWLRYFLAPMPGWRWFPVAIDCMTERSFELIDGRQIDNLEPLEFHHQYVRDVVSKDKLCVMELKDGWAPICKFLDISVPSEPFPRANDTDAVDQLAKHIMRKTSFVWLCIFASIALGGWGFGKLLLSP